MNKTSDYIVIGSGLTGSTIARLLHDAGREVLVVDRRVHVGGNVHDHEHFSGIKVHTYGPHYFRTSSDKIWDFANRFSDFYLYEACLLAKVDGQLVPWPLWKSWIDGKLGPGWKPDFCGNIPSNFEEAALSLMPHYVYERFVKEYNEKQWGVPAATLDASLCKRFDVRNDDEPRLKPEAKYQGIPVDGYASWMVAMLDGIPAITGVDFLKEKKAFRAKKKLIFTGPIDEFFEFELGKLKYRGQKRENFYYPSSAQEQPVGQVNTPQHKDGPSIRRLEWRHMMNPREIEKTKGTLVTTETPFSPTNPNEYEYPFPDKSNAELYSRYREKANSRKDLVICGRLGEYKYYDMDQSIARAFLIAESIMDNKA